MGKRITDYLKLNLFKGDMGIWMIYFLLCIISLVEIYSAASNLTFKSGNHWDPVLNQAFFLFLGLLVILAMIRIPCKFFKLIPIIGLPIALLMLLYVLVMQRGLNDAARWIDIFGIRFQPSEFAKSMLILEVAVILSKVNRKRKKQTAQTQAGKYAELKKAFYMIVFCAGLTCGLIAPENFSTAAMLALVIAVMMYVGNIPKRLLGKTFLFLLAVGAIGITFVIITPDAKLGHYRRALTWKHRITDKISSAQAENKTSVYHMDDNWQECASHIAIANSNVIGLGVGNSIERDFLPHAESDFIYSIIVEETGVVGGILVMMLYITLLVRVWRIAQRSDKYFPAYLVIGLGLMLVVQALVNMAVAVGLAPVTGQTLPLISHGGTSILVTSFNIGMILSVSRYVERVNASRAAAVETTTTHETEEYASGEGMV